ncbi:BREX-1 system adenine-specific DNA-methyltransferase PglX [uncultured Bacteroides sp.]|uniref:BREX-1 system adenine-specific DNA-methyltransferase PglX n=1 Tax=uncultured Bacteroides sp. TaxID=162156 RepID=UPI002603BCAA|nr:BREX-1 system adenine-specific DNA-methyltransferase PglX [uncultured Bacteroides sp.]
MDTNRLKKFATEARNILKAGIAAKLTGLGFDCKGEVPDNLRPQLLQGGTLWNGQTFPEGFYHQWMRLYEQVQAKGVNEVYEQAAYTWFNRLVAIRILQKNGLCEPVSTYADSARTPQIVNQARQGLFPPMEETAKRHLLELLDDDTKVTEQFAVLLVAWCHANPILQRCFGTMEDYTELLLPANILAENGFIDLLNHTEFITDEEFRSPELIGWLYQFYISERKDEVFAKKGKFEADEIPAATQIFTPNWIVKYMVQNTVGRIYLDNNPSATSMMKQKWQYLVEPAEPTPANAVLHYNELTDLKVADLACGSGHILNECFDLLYDLYIAEGYTRSEAITHIFQDNLTGIDLDPRAQQLSLFALTLKACQRDHSFADAHCLPRVLTMPKHLNMIEEELSAACLEFVGGYEDVVAEWLEGHLELMKDADSLGSIMKFDLDADEYAFYKAKYEDWTQDGEEAEDIPVAVKQLLPSVKLILALSEKYDALVMNPPYMGGGNMNEVLSKYVKYYYEEGKADLFSVFMELAIERLKTHGRYGMINMQSWMFLSSFEKLRKTLLDNYHIESMLHLGPRTFDELSGEVVQNTAFVVAKHNANQGGTYFRLVEGKCCADKEQMFLNYDEQGAKIYYPNVPQANFEKIPGCPIGYWVSELFMNIFCNSKKLAMSHDVKKGIDTGKNEIFLRYWYEVSSRLLSLSTSTRKWFTYIKGGDFKRWYGNIELVVNWDDDGREIREFPTSTIRNQQYMKKEAITWTLLSSKCGISARYVEPNCLFDNNGSSAFPLVDKYYLCAFLNSKVANVCLSILNPTLAFQVGNIASLPYKSSRHKSEIEDIASQNISISKYDWNSHETSWDFQQNELISLIDSTEQDLTIESLTSLCSATVYSSTEKLQPQHSVAASTIQQRCIGDTAALQAEESPRAVRLQDLMERYHEKWNTLFMQLHANEEELNRQFIDIYGLQDELTPDVPLSEITILQQGEISIENE